MNEKKLKSIIMNTIRIALLFIILICLYFITLFIISCIPSKYIQDNVKDSSEQIRDLGQGHEYDLGYKKEHTFIFTDAIMVNTSYSMDSKDKMNSILLARRSYIPGKTLIVNEDRQNVSSQKEYMDQHGNSYQTDELYDLMHTDNVVESFEYARYWHGYLVILRPLLVFFNYNQIKNISVVLIFILTTSLLYLIAKKINWKIMMAFLFTFLAIGLPAVAKCLNEVITFYIALISSIILLLKYDKLKKYIGTVFFVIGSLTAFFDFLTTPILTYGILVILFFLLKQKEEKITWKETLAIYFKTVILWGLGYFLTWSSKWAIVDVILNKDIIANALSQLAIRSGDSNISRLALIAITWERMMRSMGRYVIIAISNITVITLLGGIIRIFVKKTKLEWKNILPYLISIFIPIVWILAIGQHSAIHSFFVYRILAIAILSIGVIVIELCYKKEENRKGVSE